MYNSRETPFQLYIVEYFVNHKVVKHPMYAQDFGQAVERMNNFYADNGKGHAHKSLEHCATGVEIEGVYYAAELPVDADF